MSIKRREFLAGAGIAGIAVVSAGAALINTQDNAGAFTVEDYIEKINSLLTVIEYERTKPPISYIKIMGEYSPVFEAMNEDIVHELVNRNRSQGY